MDKKIALCSQNVPHPVFIDLETKRPTSLNIFGPINHDFIILSEKIRYHSDVDITVVGQNELHVRIFDLETNILQVQKLGFNILNFL